MEVTKQNKILALNSELKETSENNLATEYIIENFDKIVKYAIHKGADESKAPDLVMDMYIKLLEEEQNGEGYSCYMEDGYNKAITVENFIFGRAKQYALNKKYKNKYIEVTNNGVLIHSIVKTNATETDSDKENDIFDIVADELNEYNMQEIEDSEDFRKNIELCLDIADLHKFNIKSFFKNIDVIKGLVVKNNCEALSTLKELVARNDEFADALIRILKYSEDKNINIYNYIVAQSV